MPNSRIALLSILGQLLVIVCSWLYIRHLINWSQYQFVVCVGFSALVYGASEFWNFV